MKPYSVHGVDAEIEAKWGDRITRRVIRQGRDIAYVEQQSIATDGVPISGDRLAQTTPKEDP